MAETAPVTALVERSEKRPRDTTLSEVLVIAEHAYRSGMYPDSRSVSAAVMKILAGREMGFGPTASLTGISIFSGKVDLGAHLRAATIKRRNEPGNDHYDIEVIEDSDQACELQAWERVALTGGETRKLLPGWRLKGSLRYTMEYAISRGWNTYPNGKPKPAWEMKPRNLLYCNCLNDLYKTHFADLAGGVRTYDTDELELEREPQRQEPAQATMRHPVQDAEFQPVAPPESLPAPQVNGEPAPVTDQATDPGDQPATPMMSGEQRDEFCLLVDSLNIKPGQLAERLSAKYGDGDWHNLTAAQAQETIEKLRARKEELDARGAKLRAETAVNPPAKGVPAAAGNRERL